MYTSERERERERDRQTDRQTDRITLKKRKCGYEERDKILESLEFFVQLLINLKKRLNITK
jgi:hypothetical protein